MTVASYGYVGQAYAAAASVSYSPTAGNLIKLSVGYTKLTGTPVPAISDNLGNTYLFAQSPQQGSTSGNYLGTWYLPNIPAGITTLSVTFSAGTATPYMLVQEYTGLSLALNGSAALNIAAGMAYRTAPGTGTGAIASSAVNIGCFPAMLSSVVFDPGVQPVTVAGSLTSRFSSAGDALSAGDQRFLAAGSQTALWTTANGSDNFLVECTIFAELISISNQFASAESGGAISLTLASKTAKAGDTVISYCLTPVGIPTVVDSGSGTWSSVVKVAGPTGGARGYSIYRATRFCPTATSFTVTWTQAGSVSGIISATGIFAAGLGSISPIDTAAIPAYASGSSTALLSNTSNTTTAANELMIFIGSTDTSSTCSYTIGLLAGTTGINCMTDSGSTGPNIAGAVQTLNSTGTYSGAATGSVNNHWVAALDFFSATNLNFPYSLSAGALTYAYTVEPVTFSYGPNTYTLLCAPLNYNYSVAQSAADYVLNASPLIYSYSVQPAAGGAAGPGFSGVNVQSLLIGIRIGI